MEKNNVKKILLIRYEHIGDYSLTVPRIASIRKKFPDAKIDVVVGPWNKGFAEATHGINRIILFDNPLVERNMTYLRILKIMLFESQKIFKHLQELKKENYDLLINFSDRKFSLLLDRLTKAKKKVLGTDYPYIGEREVDRMDRMLRESLDIQEIITQGDLNYSFEDIRIVDSLLEELNAQDKKLVLVHAVSPYQEKDWPLEKWKEFIKKASEKNKDLLFLFLGSPDQKEELDKIIRNLGIKNIKNIAGKTSVIQFILLISKCDLIMGSDSGPVHFAELTKTPIITLYGPTFEERWGPPKNRGMAVREGSIKSLPVEKVFKAFEKMLR